MLVKFNPYYGTNGGESKNNENILKYSFTGIITGMLTFQGDSENSISKGKKKSDTTESMKLESTKDHNKGIIENIYKKQFFLSQILKLISDHKKKNNSIPSLYILISCRNYIDNTFSTPSIDQPLKRFKSVSNDYHNIFDDFCDKINIKLRSDSVTNPHIIRLLKENIEYFSLTYHIHSINFNLLFFYLINRDDLLVDILRKYLRIIVMNIRIFNENI